MDGIMVHCRSCHTFSSALLLHLLRIPRESPFPTSSVASSAESQAHGHDKQRDSDTDDQRIDGETRRSAQNNHQRARHDGGNSIDRFDFAFQPQGTDQGREYHRSPQSHG